MAVGFNSAFKGLMYEIWSILKCNDHNIYVHNRHITLTLYATNRLCSSLFTKTPDQYYPIRVSEQALNLNKTTGKGTYIVHIHVRIYPCLASKKGEASNLP